jgi:hypothetical protein
VNTSKELGRIAGVSRDIIIKVEFLLANADEQTKHTLRAGESTINCEYQRLRRLDIKAANEVLRARNPAPPDGTYDVVVVDPPWPVDDPDLAYPTMPEHELLALHIPAAADFHLFVWSTQHFLPMAFRLLSAWGFTYQCTFVWHNNKGPQPTAYPHFNCEFALYARRGNPKFVDTKRFATCFEAPRGRHSEKPEKFYAMLRRVTAG